MKDSRSRQMKHVESIAAATSHSMLLEVMTMANFVMDGLLEARGRPLSATGVRLNQKLGDAIKGRWQRERTATE